jgi:hypothetical protein
MLAEKDGLHAAASRTAKRYCDCDCGAPLATLALNPLLQSRDEMNARFGGGQIMGAWLGEKGRQAVAIEPCIAPGPSVHSNRGPHCRRRSCHVAARFNSLYIHIVVHIASLFASNAHLLLSQVQWDARQYCLQRTSSYIATTCARSPPCARCLCSACCCVIQTGLGRFLWLGDLLSRGWRTAYRQGSFVYLETAHA